MRGGAGRKAADAVGSCGAEYVPWPLTAPHGPSINYKEIKVRGLIPREIGDYRDFYTTVNLSYATSPE